MIIFFGLNSPSLEPLDPRTLEPFSLPIQEIGT